MRCKQTDGQMSCLTVILLSAAADGGGAAPLSCLIQAAFKPNLIKVVP